MNNRVPQGAGRLKHMDDLQRGLRAGPRIYQGALGAFALGDGELHLVPAEEEKMIDHTGVNVSNFEASKKFYLEALAPLGYVLMLELPLEVTGGKGGAGFGVPPKPDFWIGGGEPQRPHVHIAFTASSRAQVDAFYQAAINAGARDNGPPGLRPHYHPNYYGAFVFDPDGHNIEVVCHEPA